MWALLECFFIKEDILRFTTHACDWNFNVNLQQQQQQYLCSSDTMFVVSGVGQGFFVLVCRRTRRYPILPAAWRTAVVSSAANTELH